MYSLSVILGCAVISLLALRLSDERAERMEWARLAALQPTNPERYDPVMVADLPEPARRFFNFAIKPGTPLLTVAEIDMGGEFSLGTRDNPNYQPMDAREILATPTGFRLEAQDSRGPCRCPALTPAAGRAFGFSG